MKAQIDAKKADKVKSEEVVEYGYWNYTLGDFGGTLSHVHDNVWEERDNYTLVWNGGTWWLQHINSGMILELSGLSSDTSLTFDGDILAAPIVMTRVGYSSQVLTANVVYGDTLDATLSAYATNAKVNSLSSDYIKRNANTITTPGVVTDYLASNLVGGVRVRFSAHNLDNYTAYAYSGVAVRRNASTDDYLFDSSQNGIARMKDISAIVEAYLAQNAG